MKSFERALNVVDPVHSHVAHDQIEALVWELVSPLLFLIHNQWDNFVRLHGSECSILTHFSDDIVAVLCRFLTYVNKSEFFHLKLVVRHIPQESVRIRA